MIRADFAVAGEGDRLINKYKYEFEEKDLEADIVLERDLNRNRFTYKTGYKEKRE